MAYATVEDVEAASGKTFSDSEVSRATFLLDVASGKLDCAISRYGIDADAKAAQVKQVCALMVADAMSAPAGLSSHTMQAGEFRETTTYASARNGLSVADYLDLLGVSGGHGIGSIAPEGLL